MDQEWDLKLPIANRLIQLKLEPRIDSWDYRLNCKRIHRCEECGNEFGPADDGSWVCPECQECWEEEEKNLG